MNSDIDLKHFGSGGAPSGSESNGKLIGPPRRIISRYIVPLLLLAGFAAVGAYAFRGAFEKTTGVTVTMPVLAPDGMPPAMTPINVTANLPVATKQSLFQAPGWIEPEPYPIIISSLRMGTVESVEVIEGQDVTSGTVVARLVDEDARLAVDAAESAFKLKEARYEAAVKHWKNPTSLVESVETARAKREKLSAEARRLGDLLELARLEAKIGQTLTESGYEASLETVRKETEMSAARNQMAATQAEIKLNSATLSASTERLTLRIEDREAVAAAKAELLAAETDLAKARLGLERSIIMAPTSGTIMRLMVSPGSMLSTEMAEGMTIASMYKPEKLQVRVDVPLNEAAKVIPGLPAEITVEALPDKVFTGELVNIVPEFNLQKNVLPVKVRINNPVPSLRPEMIARVEFFQRQQREISRSISGVSSTASVAMSGGGDAVLIPEDVVISDGDKSIVMVAGPDNVAYSREVAATEASDGMMAVSKGLHVSDKVIVSPKNIQAGDKVKIKGYAENGSH